MRALDDESERSCELARWLVEVGKRRWVRRDAGAPAAPVREPETACTHARLVLFGILAAALFQYFYLDALLEVASLRALIVFVLPGAAG